MIVITLALFYFLHFVSDCSVDSGESKISLHSVFISTIITTEGLLNLQKAKLIQASYHRDWCSAGRAWAIQCFTKRDLAYWGASSIFRKGLAGSLLQNMMD